jgi:hypothetical protein
LESFVRDGSQIFLADSLSLYGTWDEPVVIVSDGPYGLGNYPGDPSNPDDLPELYLPSTGKTPSVREG